MADMFKFKAGSDQHLKYMNTQMLVEIRTDGDDNECLTSSFTTMRIINSIRSCWPIIELHFMIDNQPMIEKNIYGTKDIEVDIIFLDEEGEEIKEPVKYNLLYMEANIVLPQKPHDNGPWDDEKEEQRRKLVISCLSKPSFLAMAPTINRLWEGDDTGMIPLDFIYEILDLKGVTDRRILAAGKNEDTVPQLLIPPMTIKSACDFIHEKFGIFKGPMFRYADFTGKFLMWDLKERWEQTKASGFTKTHKMPGFSDQIGLYEEVNELVATDPYQFITYDHVQTLHYGNSLVGKYGYDNIYITHPHEDIAYFHKWKTDEIVTEYGLWHDVDKLKFHPEMKIRKKYFSDWKGFEVADGYTGIYNDFSMRSSLAELFKDAASVRFTIYRKVKLHMLERVGEVAYFQPYSKHEMEPGSNYEGAYLVTDSEIILTRESNGIQEDNLECFATITACRTAQSKD